MRSYDTEKDSKKPEQESDDFLFSSVRGVRAGLYLVATPIGNLRDISLRALDVLRAADVVLCEDTRVTRKLLSAYGVKVRLEVYNDHSDTARRGEIVGKLQEGNVIALVSDAGMPLISDPGYKLVQDVQAAGLYVSSVPGANAPLSALQLSGMPSDCFSFIGFLPNKTKARKDILRNWIDVQTTLVTFETAPRLLDALADIGEIFGAREVAVVREITKMFEEVRKGTPDELLAHYTASGLPKGEIVLVIAPPVAVQISPEDIERQVRNALKTMRTKEAAAFVSERTGHSRKELYDLALKLSKETS